MREGEEKVGEKKEGRAILTNYLGSSRFNGTTVLHGITIFFKYLDRKVVEEDGSL